MMPNSMTTWIKEFKRFYLIKLNYSPIIAVCISWGTAAAQWYTLPLWPSAAYIYNGIENDAAAAVAARRLLLLLLLLKVQKKKTKRSSLEFLIQRNTRKISSAPRDQDVRVWAREGTRNGGEGVGGNLSTLIAAIQISKHHDFK